MAETACLIDSLSTIVFGLPLGAPDDDPKIKPMLHAFVGSKASWHDITDNLPQFQELPK